MPNITRRGLFQGLLGLAASAVATHPVLQTLAKPTIAAARAAKTLLFDYFVDPMHGSDVASGARGFPLKTFAELSRRLAGATIEKDMTIHVLSDVPASDPVINAILPSGGKLTICGYPRVNL